MSWEILFNPAFNKLEELAKGEAEDTERVPEGVFTFADLRSIVRAVRKMGVERDDALREGALSDDILDDIEQSLRRRES